MNSAGNINKGRVHVIKYECMLYTASYSWILVKVPRTQTYRAAQHIFVLQIDGTLLMKVL